MKLAEATGLAQLRDDGLSRQRVSKEIKPALELARDIFAEAEDREQPFLYHTPESWVRKWLPSKRFRLMRVALNAVAMPCEPKVDNLVLKKIHAMETKPIIVDYNKNQVGKSFHGFVPQVIVIDGKHRFKASALRGETHIMAWVGEEAIREMQAVGGGGPAPESTTPAPGARLNAKGSMQDASLQQRQGSTYAEGKKLKTLNVVEGGGPGSGRHPEFGSFVKKREEASGSGGSIWTRYESPQNSNVIVNEQGYRRMSITGPDGKSTAMSSRDGKKHLRETYGINHGS